MQLSYKLNVASHAVATLLAVAFVFVPARVTTAASDDFALASSRYLNRYYQPTGSVSTISLQPLQPPAVAFFGGNVGRAGVANTPTDSKVYLTKSAFAQPVASAPFLKYDFLFGQEIVPTPLSDVNTNLAPGIVPTNHAFYLTAEHRLFASEPGYVDIIWNLNSGGTRTNRYLISNLPVREPVWIYWTHVAGQPTGAPSVDVSGVRVVPHYNSLVTSDVLVTNGNSLSARNSAGLVMLEYRHKTTGSFLGVEIVQVRRYAPDFTLPVEVGSVLAPRNTYPNTTKPLVSRGLTNGGPPYVYSIVGDRRQGDVFAVRPTLPPAYDQVELIWSRPAALAGVVWPYEITRYTADWPTNFNTVARRIYRTDDDHGRTRAPTVNITSEAAPKVTIHYNDVILGTNVFWFDVGRQLHASVPSGRVLLHYDNDNNPTNGFLGIQFVDVRPFLPDWTDDWHIGDQLRPQVAQPDPVPPVPVVSNGLQTSGDFAYQHNNNPGPMQGFVYAVKKTTSDEQLEVFWNRSGLGGVVWPYEMHHYRTTWPANVPAKYQRYVRGDNPVLGPKTQFPPSLNASRMPFQEPNGHASEINGEFFTTQPGWSLLKYTTASNAVFFQVVRSVNHTDPVFDLTLRARVIGTEIANPTHQGPLPGYIHRPFGDRYDWEVYDGKPGDPPAFRTGQIFPVNRGSLEVWWANTNLGVQWYSLVQRYTNSWPNSSPEIVIASQAGTGAFNPVEKRNYRYYAQNNPGLPGFNPNDEHALNLDNAGGPIFALRDDLGSPTTSEPYVLVKYQGAASDLWNYTVYRVLAEKPPSVVFNYPATAGVQIQEPLPLSILDFPPSLESTHVSGPAWRDRKLFYWAKSAGDNGGTANIVMRYFYRIQDGFYFPDGYFGNFPSGIPRTNLPPAGSRFPWLDLHAGTPGTPQNVNYNVQWPTSVPQLRVAETLVKPKFGLPDISLQTSVEILYQQPTGTAQGPLVKLVDPTREIDVPLANPPDDVQTVLESGKRYFSTLPPQLRTRFFYDDTAKKLKFKGLFVEPAAGEYWLLPNVITAREKPILRGLSGNSDFKNAVDSLSIKAANVVEVPPNPTNGFNSLALTAGLAKGNGYVTLAFGSSTNLTPPSDPVSLKVIKVVCPTYQGEIKVIKSDNPFDEKLTLRHSGDFAGKADDYIFEWKTLPPADGGLPSLPPSSWNGFPTVPSTGEGALDITIEGSGVFTLTDNYFICRYRPKTAPVCPASTNLLGWSEWTSPQLAEGWIKRVVGDINPFTQRASSGGLNDAESRFAAYHNQQVNTVVSMISQAGRRSSGDVPLNNAGAQNFGLIEIYETVMKRGVTLSIEGAPPFDYGPANDALLLVGSRISDLYMLLGNEAYADAADPTIGFGTDSATYGNEATSIHCFQNQTVSLLEEELALLRGRDDRLQPPASTVPFFNRLIWNFTRAEGEVAYTLNYDVQDQNRDSVIDAVDASMLYPQGHGDAWGHYLTAIKVYYRLLRSPYFSWVPRAEAVLVAGVPVSVDYYDERRFAAAAAARARAGAEIVNLAYRDKYVEDPAGQWQGYRDGDTNRAWGLAEWGSRAAQGALFDWAVANALLPDVDRNSAHTGIQKIDRTTVPGLREIVGSLADIQAKVDMADGGLNPLGLAKNVIPFDIDPTAITQGKSHFEQIYDRSVKAMNNAIAVFNHANNASQLLRRQLDTINDFQKTVGDRENDFTNRLIEVFGYPYAQDIGPGKTYPSGYNGPDLVHFGYIDVNELTGVPTPTNQTLRATLQQVEVQPDGGLSVTSQAVDFPIALDGYKLAKPAGWTSRLAQGEVQRALGEIVQSQVRFEKLLQDYDNLLTQIEDQAGLLRAQYNVGKDEIFILDEALNQQIELNAAIKASRTKQQVLRTSAQAVNILGTAVAEFIPTSLGTGTDALAPLRGAIRLVSAGIAQVLNTTADFEALGELDQQQAKEITQSAASLKITTIRNDQALLQQLVQLQQLVRQEASFRYDLYLARDALGQMAANYQSTLARGLRLSDERARFRAQTAAQVQGFRYKDMAFRIFRNDALQKYRAQFDLAAMYVYLAARAYDYETCFQIGDPRHPGSDFMNDIIQARTLGLIESGQPHTGGQTGDGGLADPLARMWGNWDLNIKGQLGFNNPQTETARFSLRYELFRTQTNSDSKAIWREVLARSVVTNVYALPEFRRYCVPFSANAVEPGLVIPFGTTIQSGFNFFVREAGGGDNTYSTTHFATKVRSVGVWFANYNSQGLINTPRVYLVPIGLDTSRSSTDLLGELRTWQILDQLLPFPFSLTPGALTNQRWIPNIDTLGGQLAAIRRYPDFRAYHDGGNFNPSETSSDSRLIGRSVWNTKWLLIIPAVTLNSDRNEGIRRFIYGTGASDGVTDIKLFFQTYAF